MGIRFVYIQFIRNGDYDMDYNNDRQGSDAGSDEEEYTEEFLKDISAQLGKQIEEEIEEDNEERLTREAAEEYDAQDTSDAPEWDAGIRNQSSKEEAVNMSARHRKKKKHTGLKIVGGILGTLILACVFLVGTPIGRRLLIRLVVTYVDSGINRGTMTATDAEGNTVVVDEEGNILTTDENGNVITNVGHEKPNTHESPADARSEDYVTNILLVGIESVLPGSRADTLMIASLNTKDKTIKLTSILRDTYVQIPGYNKTKINAAYGKGGMKSVYETIETNFKIKLDGYVLVGFDGLEAIVDRIGGVEIELTETEANYLNTTNYISKEEYRNVKPGVNLLNGNQVVGYCRVRKVPTQGGANYDFGRTVRQRRVLSTVFEAYKSKGVTELVVLMNRLLGYVTTDLTKQQMEDLLVDFIENRITEIESLQIPAEGAYTSRRVDGVGSVLDPDLEANIEILYDFIFDDGTEEVPEDTTEGSSAAR